ncbi:MAG: hypothetical protein AB7O97_03870 [Planctomycetota bacterium]
MPHLARLSRPVLFLGVSVLAGCAVVPEDAKPQVRFGLELADTYVHRGMPQNTRGVLQGTMDLTLPTENGQVLQIGTFANLDLASSTGDAWMPDGHGGRVTETDLSVTYAHSFENGLDLAAGLQNYTLPNGESFPNGPREQTNELFVHLQTELLGTRPELQIRHDVDQANGTYLRLGVSEPFELGEKLVLRLSSHIGRSSQSQSFWNYGLRANGLADLQGRAALEYAWDDRTVIGASLNGSTIVDDGLSDWFDIIGIDTEHVWVTAFVSWTL